MSLLFCLYAFRGDFDPFCAAGVGLNPVNANVELSLTFTENRNIRSIFTCVKYLFKKSLLILNNTPLCHLDGKQYRYILYLLLIFQGLYSKQICR